MSKHYRPRFNVGDTVKYIHTIIGYEITVMITDVDYEHYQVVHPKSNSRWIIRLQDLDHMGYRVTNYNKIWREAND